MSPESLKLPTAAKALVNRHGQHTTPTFTRRQLMWGLVALAPRGPGHAGFAWWGGGAVRTTRTWAAAQTPGDASSQPLGSTK